MIDALETSRRQLPSLSLAEAVRESFAVGREAIRLLGLNERLGEQACAVVVASPGQTVTLADLTSFLTEKGLAKVKLPEHLVLVSELAMNTGGKIDKPAIQKHAAITLGRWVEPATASA